MKSSTRILNLVQLRVSDTSYEPKTEWLFANRISNEKTDFFLTTGLDGAGDVSIAEAGRWIQDVLNGQCSMAAIALVVQQLTSDYGNKKEALQEERKRFSWQFTQTQALAGLMGFIDKKKQRFHLPAKPRRELLKLYQWLNCQS